MRRITSTLEESSIPEPNSGCWLWLGAVNNKGYGQRWVEEGNGRHKRLAHRLSYQQFVGPIPEGLCVLHKCDTPLCINPQHLWLGTKTDNARDRDHKGRTAKGAAAFKDRKGAAHPYAKLTEDQVRAIRKDPRGSRPIAKEYGLHDAHVRDIRSGKCWKHVKET